MEETEQISDELKRRLPRKDPSKSSYALQKYWHRGSLVLCSFSDVKRNIIQHYVSFSACFSLDACHFQNASDSLKFAVNHARAFAQFSLLHFIALIQKRVIPACLCAVFRAFDKSIFPHEFFRLTRRAAGKFDFFAYIEGIFLFQNLSTRNVA